MAASVASRRTGNLPIDVTSFVGRREGLAEVRKLLASARLITLTGPGGVGKTRLALRSASQLRRTFPDGAWLVELAGLRDAGLVGQSVASALGVVEPASVWSLGALSERIGERDLLIVLDNCEHLVDACAALADTLLRTCPNVRILATSRQPLRIAGEHLVEVHPLTAPPPEAVVTLESVDRNEAVTLFVERAIAVQPGFRLDEGNVAAVSAVCRRLDGIPLALELGAGRLRALSIEELLSRLDSRFDVLIGGSRAALPRQQTLRALIDWSYALCTEDERLLWARLSVFVDGFSLDSVEEVCAGERLPRSVVLNTVAGLVEKSIVSVDTTRGNVRYRMPETLREYGAERLEERGERVTTQRRVRGWVGQLVERVQSAWFGPEQADLLSELRTEHSNIRTGLEFCLTGPTEAIAGMAIAAALQEYWIASGQHSEGSYWLDRLLASNRGATAQRLGALCTCVRLKNSTDSVETIDGMLDEADTLARELGDVWGTASVAMVRGMSMLYRGQADAAVGLIESSVAGHRAVGDRAATAYDLAMLAVAKIVAGDADVLGVLDECIDLCAAAGESSTRAIALWASGIERFRAGDLLGADAAQRTSLRLRVGLGSPYLVARSLDVLAWVSLDKHEPERSARLFGAAEAIMRDLVGAVMSWGPTANFHEDYQARARQALGADAFDAAFDVGLHMTFDEVIAFALDEVPTPPSAPLRAARNADLGSGPLAEGLPVLTQREWEVARLVAEGLSNRQIAGRLVISQRTAEGHVEHVLTKLGFTSRSQIAAWAVEQDAGSAGSSR
jgi:predicted ATPase/DNA-binding CsgD family transcriptional regulator